MASAAVTDVLLEISQSPNQAEGYEALLSKLSTKSPIPPNTENLTTIADAIFESNLGIVATRALCVHLTNIISTSCDNDTKLNVGQHILDILATQPGSFEDQNAFVREFMATAHEDDEDFLAAASILAGIPVDSSSRKVTPSDKARLWIRITRNYLEVDDTTSAETYLNKFKNVIHQVDDPELRVHFQLSQARIQDARREFLVAGRGYQDISLIPTLAEDERLRSLSMAVKCAVLAPAGPARSRDLKSLYNDERSASLDEFGILEKVFFDRLIAPTEVAKFAEGLAPHQLARTSDGSTVLVKAMSEHNLLGASRIYNNIGFAELGRLLGVDAEKAEETTARMIEQGRLVGRIDQIDGIIYFEGMLEATGEKGSGRSEGLVGRELRRWDSNVQGLAEEVEKVTSQLQTRYPDFVAANLVV